MILNALDLVFSASFFFIWSDNQEGGTKGGHDTFNWKKTAYFLLNSFFYLGGLCGADKYKESRLYILLIPYVDIGLIPYVDIG